tara:strand:+ start:382 stop:648 length:267 start_codon:yes stop_codon:yes gene_type:complete
MRFGVALCRAYGSSNVIYLGIEYKKKSELTGIENKGGAGERLLIFTAFLLQQLGGGLWLKELTFYSPVVSCIAISLLLKVIFNLSQSS